MALSFVTSSRAARGRQEPGACASFPTYQGHSKAVGAPPRAQRPRLLLRPLCLTPAPIRPQSVSLLLDTLNICAFPLLPLLFLPPPLPAPPLHVPFQNKHAKSPCTFAKHRGEVCTKRKDDGFSFLCKGTLSATFFLGAFIQSIS